MKISAIYKIQSIIKPERVYIGSSYDITHRWNEHIGKLKKNKHHSIKLQNHFNKYGEIDLQFSILLGCEKEDLIKTEQYFIDSYNPWFNICRNAGNTLGRMHSEETKERIRCKNKGRILFAHTPESKQKLSIAFKDKPLSEETKQKFRDGWEQRRIRLGKPRSKYLIKKYGT